MQLPKLQDVKLPTLADVRQAGAKLREVKLPEVQLPKLPVQRLPRNGGTEELAESAERLANRVLAAQLKFAGKTLHSAAPVIADGAAFLTKAADKVAARVTPQPTAKPEQAVAEVVVLAPAKPAAATEAEPTESKPSDTSTIKARTAKPRTAKTGTAKAAAAKPTAAKGTSAARKAKTDKK
jgi:hypothetical protein